MEDGAVGEKAGGMKKRFTVAAPILFLLLTVLYRPAQAYGLQVSYQYNLADFSGTIPFSYGAKLAIDKDRGEVYVTDPLRGGVTIFNTTGMEVYRFGDASDLGYIEDVAVDKKGHIYTLSYNGSRDRFFIGFCDYRGDLLSRIEVSGLPAGFSHFRPSRIFYIKGGTMYLADDGNMLVAVVDHTGKCIRTYELYKVLNFTPRMVRDDNGAFGFAVDSDGDIFLTIPTLFRAYRITPDGKAVSFGRGGSGPGRFGVAAGIAVDDNGFIYVTDRLRCCVLVFDKDLNFRTEFGYRGYGPGSLIVPSDVVTGPGGRIYVSQAGNRGVSVFSAVY